MKSLAHTIITADDVRPSRYVYFLHGILGTRANWRGVARRLVEVRPSIGAVLVDLRGHGDSLDRPGSNNVAQAALDLLELESELDAPVRGCLGHSFGGKVAMRYALERVRPLDTLVVVDSAPGRLEDASGKRDPRVSYTSSVLDTLRDLPMPVASREAFVDAIAERGFDRGVGMWLAMNLRRTSDGQRTLDLDLDVIQSLLESYFVEDTWSVIETPRPRCQVHLVIGGRSDVYGTSDLGRARLAAREHPNVHVHVIESAGHWVHVDAPDELVETLETVWSEQHLGAG